MLKTAKDSGQEVNVRCDFLNRSLLSHIKSDGCKMLHLSSEVFEAERLCIEGTNGVVEYLTLDELYNLLKPPQQEISHFNPSNKVQEDLKVELVVLALPLSNKIAEVFLNLGAKHVVSFGFESFTKYPILLP